MAGTKNIQIYIIILTEIFSLMILNGSPSFNHVICGLGIPVAIHCKMMGLRITTDNGDGSGLMEGRTAK